MIDIHNHSLYNVDDGTSNIDESIKVIRRLKKIGFTSIVLTPHYIEDSMYDADNKEKKEKYKVLKQELQEQGIEVNLYLGNEVFINDYIHENILNKNIRTINNTRYLLIEFPLNNELNGVEDIIYELRLIGYKIILAHPERYSYYWDNLKELEKLHKSVYFQCNYGTMIDKYGKKPRKVLEYLLKNKLVDFMATDIHKSDSKVIYEFDDIKRKIIKITGEKTFKDISHNNAIKVLKDEIIEGVNYEHRSFSS